MNNNDQNESENILKMLKNGQPANISKTIWNELSTKDKEATGFVLVPSMPAEVQELKKKQIEAKKVEDASKKS